MRIIFLIVAISVCFATFTSAFTTYIVEKLFRAVNVGDISSLRKILSNKFYRIVLGKALTKESNTFIKEMESYFVMKRR